MKIIYFYQYFSTPKGSWGTRVYEYAKEWVERGHEVTVVTSIYSKSDLTAVKLVTRKKIDGINVIILNIRIDNKQSPLKRIWTFIQYIILSIYFSLKEDYDIAIASSGPITVGLAGLVSKVIKRKKFVFEVRDLWPDTAIEMGFINRKWLQSLMYRFEKLCYDSANLIVTLSPGMKANIISRYGQYNIISVPNSANIELFSKLQSENVIKDEGIEENKYVIYTGNIGEINNSMLLVEVAKILKERNIPIKILIIGDGQLREEIINIKSKLGLETHLIIKGLIPKEDLVKYIKSSLASLIPLADKPLLNTSSPNKLFESLAAGVPVIQTTSGWIKDMLNENKCGISVSASKPIEMVSAIEELYNNPKLAAEMSRNAKDLALSKFDKQYLAEKMIVKIEELQ